MEKMGLVETLVRGSGLFEDPVKLLRSQVIIEKVDGVDGAAVFNHLIVAMGTRRFSGISHPANHLSSFYRLSHPSLDPHHMAIQGFVPIPVVDDHVFPIAVPLVTRYLHSSVGCCIDRSSLWSGKVQTGV